MSLILKSPDVAVFGNRVLSGLASLSSAFDMTAAGILRFDVDAIEFAGSSSHYIQYANNFWRDTDLRYTETGNAFTLSLWVNVASANTNASEAIYLLNNQSTTTNEDIRLMVQKSGTQRRIFFIYKDANDQPFIITSNYGSISLNTWHHILITSGRVGNPTNKVGGEAKIYIDDTDETDSITNAEIQAIPDSTLDTTISHQLGQTALQQPWLDGCLSEVWMKDTYYDLTQESNRRLFISAEGKPVDPPSSPLVYLKGTASTWSNTGTSTLGTQTLNNITDCADSPSD